MIEATVPPDLDGERADLVVARLGGLSRSTARSLIEGGAVLVDGAVATARGRVTAGSVVAFEEPPPHGALAALPTPFTVLYEDPHLAVVDKPSGLVTHPGARTGPTLAAGVLDRWPGVRGVGDQDRWGIVHRLDKDTSGAMVVALDAAAFAGLRAAIRGRMLVRRYLALVHGVPAAPTGTVDAPIGADRRHRGKRRVDASGKPARTHFRTLGSSRGMALLEVTLETGRTHQIRVHLGAIGLPIAGDRRYGRAAGSPRPFLHSAWIAFDHPITGERVEVACPLPDDLKQVLDALGLSVD